MKKILLSITALSAVMTFSQEKTGVNTTAPQATLDIIKTTSNTTNDVEGILIPRVSRNKALLMGGSPDIVESTLIYVNDITDYTGTDSKVVDITENGYYFWNSIKWIKTAGQYTGQEWVYNPTEQRINLVRSGLGNFANKIYYEKNGDYRSFADVSYDKYNPFSQSWLTKNIPTDNLAKNIVQIKSASITPHTYLNWLGQTSSYKQGQLNLLTVEEPSSNTNSNEYDAISNVTNSLITQKDDTKDYNSFLRSVNNSAVHQGNGNVKYLVGNYSGASILKGRSDGYVVGVRSAVSSHTPGEVDQLSSFKAYTNVGTHAGMVNGIYDFVGQNSFLQNNNSDVDEAYNIHIAKRVYPSAQTRINKAYGLRYRGFANSMENATLKEHYGIYLDNVQYGTDANYSIYTKAGKVRFGDYIIAGDQKVHNIFPSSTNITSNILGPTEFVNGDPGNNNFSSVAVFSRYSPSNVTTEAPYINFAHQAPNETIPRRGGYVKSGLVFDNSNAPIGGFMELQSAFGPANNTNWTLTNASNTKLLLNPEGGNVGVGTENPTEKLEVAGSIKANKAIFTNLPTYADDAAADADTNLPSGSLYKLTGSGRQVFVKP